MLSNKRGTAILKYTNLGGEVVCKLDVFLKYENAQYGTDLRNGESMCDSLYHYNYISAC